jgi:hypothetical protein
LDVIRHFDGTNAEQITMQSRRGVIWVVEWTWKKHRICLTAAEAERVRKVWKDWYKRRGWQVVGRFAYHPSDRIQHQRSPAVCVIRKYDAISRRVLDAR